MRWFRSLSISGAALALVTATALGIALAPRGVAARSAGTHPAAAGGQSLCIGHHPQAFVWYTASCTGHDEPEIAPLSSSPGSA